MFLSSSALHNQSIIMIISYSHILIKQKHDILGDLHFFTKLSKPPQIVIVLMFNFGLKQTKLGMQNLFLIQKMLNLKIIFKDMHKINDMILMNI